MAVDDERDLAGRELCREEIKVRPVTERLETLDNTVDEILLVHGLLLLLQNVPFNFSCRTFRIMGRGKALPRMRREPRSLPTRWAR